MLDIISLLLAYFLYVQFSTLSSSTETDELIEYFSSELYTCS